jgi:hypothetical protein
LTPAAKHFIPWICPVSYHLGKPQPLRADMSLATTEFPRLRQGVVKLDDETDEKATLRADNHDHRMEDAGELEFGGSAGCLALIVGFPLLMYYMWIGATYYDGYIPVPRHGQTVLEFGKQLGNLVYTGAYPDRRAWSIY